MQKVVFHATVVTVTIKAEAGSVIGFFVVRQIKFLGE